MLEDLLKKLIAFKTISVEHEENRHALEWLESEVKDLPVFINRYESNGFPSLTINTRETNSPTLWLTAHLDVVAGSDSVFTPKIEDGKLLGRGACDMKFAIACFLNLLKDLGRNLSGHNFGVMITTDEEVGGQNGVKYLLNRGLSSRACFLPDGGYNWEIQKAAKGVWHLKFVSLGKSTHGSRPWNGVNAVQNLVALLEKLSSQFPKEPCNVPHHFHNTLNVGKIEGGHAVNQVPDLAQAWVDIRFTTQTKKEDLQGLINKSLKYFPGISMTEVSFGESYSLDTQNRYFKTFVEIVSGKLNINPKFIFSHGSSDARFFTARGIPVILTRPTGGGSHSENEWIDLADLEKFYQVLKLFVEKVAKE